jgi:hypothetical protein
LRQIASHRSLFSREFPLPVRTIAHAFVQRDRKGARAAIADARTRHILKYMGKESWHRWSVRVPVTVISRLYARPVGVGCPDLIENSLPGATKGQEFWLTKLPWTVFTRQFE